MINLKPNPNEKQYIEIGDIVNIYFMSLDALFDVKVLNTPFYIDHGTYTVIDKKGVIHVVQHFQSIEKKKEAQDTKYVYGENE